LLGLTDTAANGGSKAFGDHANPEPDIADPFYKDGPRGETPLESVKDLDIEEITAIINRGAALVVTRAKPTIEFDTR
jgi:hypothetical protein